MIFIDFSTIFGPQDGNFQVTGIRSRPLFPPTWAWDVAGAPPDRFLTFLGAQFDSFRSPRIHFYQLCGRHLSHLRAAGHSKARFCHRVGYFQRLPTRNLTMKRVSLFHGRGLEMSQGHPWSFFIFSMLHFTPFASTCWFSSMSLPPFATLGRNGSTPTPKLEFGIQSAWNAFRCSICSLLVDSGTPK